MNAADLTSEIVGRDVLDAAGERIGRLDSLYCDAADPTVVFAAVAMIRRGRRRLVYVSLVDAAVHPATVTVRCGQLLARRAPQTRPGAELPAELESDLYRHYELRYQPRADGAPRLRPMGHAKHRR